MKGVVQGYAGPNNPFGGKDAMIENGKFVVNPQLEWTGGGYASTAEDLARWAKMMYEGKAFDRVAAAASSRWRRRTDARARNEIRARRDHSQDARPGHHTDTADFSPAI